MIETNQLGFLGGGTAGCVLANRLSACPDKTVLLIERGPIMDSWVSRVPLLSSDFSSDGSRSRKHMSECQLEVGSKQFELVNGSALGGTTRINQMLYTRGPQREYDMWAESGCEGWAWKDVEQFFKKPERFLEDGDDVNCHGKEGEAHFNEISCLEPMFLLGEWRNRGGPLFFPGFLQ